MRDILDIHTHTIASGHAYNTMMEMIHEAQKKKLEVYGITEHGPMMPGSCHDFYFSNMKEVERQHGELEVLMGAELNILNEHGELDLIEKYMKRMDVVIASLHTQCIPMGSREWNTECVINAMKNPYVNIIGHPDDGRYPLDYEAVVQAAKEYHTLLEINNKSLDPKCSRTNTRENNQEMLKYCKKYQVSVVMGSDAHYYGALGNHTGAYDILREADFPEELIVNNQKEKLYTYINKYRNV